MELRLVVLLVPEGRRTCYSQTKVIAFELKSLEETVVEGVMAQGGPHWERTLATLMSSGPAIPHAHTHACTRAHAHTH